MEHRKNISPAEPDRQVTRSRIPLDDLWREHKTRLRGYIAKRVQEHEAVDDILQEVFIKAHGNLNTVKHAGSVSAWLYRVAANAIADHYRARQPWEELSDQLPAPEAERNYIAELASCLQPLIADLPETYRDALVMSEIKGMAQREVAERLGISLSGAKSRVQRAREKLRQRLYDCCDIEIGRRGLMDYEPRDRSCHDKCGCG